MVPQKQEPETHRVKPGDAREIQHDVRTSPVFSSENQVPDSNGRLSIKPSCEGDDGGLVVQFFPHLEHGFYLSIGKETG